MLSTIDLIIPPSTCSPFRWLSICFKRAVMSRLLLSLTIPRKKCSFHWTSDSCCVLLCPRRNKPFTPSFLSYQALQTNRVDRINSLSPFILLPLDPMSVEVREQPIDIVGSRCVPFPLFRVELQQSEVRQVFGFLRERDRFEVQCIISICAEERQLAEIRSTHGS